MRFLRRLSYFLHSRSREADLSEEIAFHAAMKQRELEASGVDARRATRLRSRAMGNVTRAREDARAVWIWPWFQSVWQDLTYGARMLRKHPGFTAIAVFALATGIGLNTSLFTVTNALLFRPWDVEDSRRMVTLSSLDCCKRAGGQPNGFSLNEVAQFASHAHTITGVYAYRVTGEGGEVLVGEAKLRSAWVSPSYFSVLGVLMHRGRGFRVDADRPDAGEAEAVLSYTAWMRDFGGDTAIVGGETRVDGHAFRIVGVAPQGFDGTFGTAIDVWIPLQTVALLRPADRWVSNVLKQPANCCTAAAARLAPGVTAREAQTELAALSRNTRAITGAPYVGMFVSEFTPVAGPPGRNNEVVRVLGLLSAVMGAVLLLACANVANLLLARMAARKHEIAIRLSLGASRARIIRQLVTEGLVLALLGGVGGIMIAQWLPDVLVNIAVRQNAASVRPDATVLAFTLGLSLLTCLIFGLPPALHATQPPRTAGIRMPLRALFLSVQVALCVVLLVSAGLLVRGVQHASSENEGFAVNAVTSLSFDFRSQQIAAERTKPFVTQLTYALRNLPRATTVGLSTGIPLSSTGKSEVRLPGEEESRSHDILLDQVTDQYFDVLGIPRVAGASFAAEQSARGTIIVNETLAQQYGDASAIVGKTVLLGGAPARVIGVVKDFRASSLERVEPTAYQPFTGEGMANVLVRNDAPGAAAAIAALARRIDPGVSVTIVPLSVFLDRRLAPSRTLARVSGALGVLALVMATIGVFGVFAFAVQQRTQEIGIRMALGARAAEVVGLVLKSSARAIGAGLFVGFIGAFLASRMLGANLYGLSPLDPATYLSVALVLLSAGLTAAYWPARRATHIAPASALRIE